MKTLHKLFLVAIVAITSPFVFGAANDIKMSQQNSGGTAWIDRIFAPTANSIIGSNGSNQPGIIADVRNLTSLGVGTGTAAPATEMEVDSTSTSSPRGIMSGQFNTGTDGARFHGRKARGTRAVPLTIVTGDNLTRWVGSGYDGSNFLEDASIIFGTEGTVAATRVPTNIQFWTATDAGPSVLTEVMRINSAQNLLLGSSSNHSGERLQVTGTVYVSGTAAAASLSLSSLTSGRVTFATTAGLLTDASTLTFNSGTGALTATTFIGALTGNASTATTAGTVTTAAQAAITSVGTLTSISTSGNLNLSSGSTTAYIGIVGGGQETLHVGNNNSNLRSVNVTAAQNTGTSASTAFLVSGGTNSGTDLLTILHSGNTTLSSLAGTGSRAVVADANGLLSAPVSDETWKENIRELPEGLGLSTVLALRPLVFNYKDKFRFGTQDYLGFGARATSVVLPQVTGQDKNGTFYLSDEKLTAVLVKGMQQQQVMIGQIKSGLNGANADWWARGLAAIALMVAIRANCKKK